MDARNDLEKELAFDYEKEGNLWDLSNEELIMIALTKLLKR